MANPEDRFEENAPGKFYVDDQCIDCDLCRDRLPGVFSRNDAEAHSFVARQPQTPEELEDSLLALDDCPVEAIGNDGISSQVSVQMS